MSPLLAIYLLPSVNIRGSKIPEKSILGIQYKQMMYILSMQGCFLLSLAIGSALKIIDS